MTRRTSPLTVVHLFSGDLWAGAEVAVFNLLSQLRHSPELRLVAIALNEGTLSRRLDAVGVETLVLPEAGTSFAGLSRAVYRLLRGRHVDIIHSHRYKENLLACLVAKTLGAPSLVSTVHGLSDPPVPGTGAARLRAKTRLDYFVLRHCFNRVVAVSADVKRTLVKAYRFPQSRVEVIHNGIPLPQDPPRRAGTSDLLHIGSVGRLDPVKRFDLFLAAAARVRAQTHRVRFSILGDGPDRSELLNTIRALKLDGSVELLAACTDPLPYYQSLDIYLNTSLHEGLPLSILEAMACARPVVAPRVGGIPEIVTHGVDGLLVDSSQPDDFARSCVSLLSNERMRAAMGDRARTTVAAGFLDVQMADAYRDVYFGLSDRCATPLQGRRLAAAPQRL